MSEATMVKKSHLDVLVDKIEKQIPHSAALICVVGLAGAGKTTVTNVLHSRGFLTYDPLAEYVAKYPEDRDAAKMLQVMVRGEYNRTRPKSLVLDDFPFSEDQLEFCRELVGLYEDDLIVVHLMCPIYTRHSRKREGMGLQERMNLFSSMAAEEKQTKALYSKLAKFVPWYIQVDAG